MGIIKDDYPKNSKLHMINLIDKKVMKDGKSNLKYECNDIILNQSYNMYEDLGNDITFNWGYING